MIKHILVLLDTGAVKVLCHQFCALSVPLLMRQQPNRFLSALFVNQANTVIMTAEFLKVAHQVLTAPSLPNNQPGVPKALTNQ